jgi:hypothetical protein
VLRVRGEQEWRVDPLGLLPAGAGLAALAEAPAVRLLVERVRDVRPGFELTDGNAAAVAELCRRLDGLPLALELAAARMRLLTPEQMLQRLDERMERPGALADLPDRQQTMTAALEWTCSLLPEPARRLPASQGPTVSAAQARPLLNQPTALPIEDSLERRVSRVSHRRHADVPFRPRGSAERHSEQARRGTRSSAQPANLRSCPASSPSTATTLLVSSDRGETAALANGPSGRGSGQGAAVRLMQPWVRLSPTRRAQGDRTRDLLRICKPKFAWERRLIVALPLANRTPHSGSCPSGRPSERGSSSV